MRASIAALTAASVIVTGCATPGSWRDALPATSTLEVSNRTEERVQIVVKGAAEGAVEPGERKRFRWLAPGPAHILAMGTLTKRRDTSVTLKAGAVHLWEFGEARPAAPPLAELVVENTLKHPVHISVASKAYGVLLAGDTRTLRDLSAAEVTLSALARETGLQVASRVTLTPNAPSHWRIAAPMSKATVINDSPVSLTLSLDGHEVGQVLAGDTLELPEVAAGEHVFTAVAAGSGLSRRHAFNLHPERPYTWSVSSERGSIEIVNDSGETLELTLATKETPEALEQGMSLRLSDVTPGSHRIKALGRDTKMPYAATLVVRPGQEVRWHVTAVGNSLRVINKTRRDLELYVDASWRARLGAGDSHTLRNLDSKAHELVAVSPDGRKRYKRNVDAPAVRSSTWEIIAESGSLKVANARPTPMMVFVDGRGLGTLQASAQLTFTGIETGRRLFEAIDLVSGETLKHYAVVSADAVTSPSETWRLEAPTGTLVITNSSSEAVLTEGTLATKTSAIAPGDTRRFELSTGELSIRLIGDESGVAHFREMSLRLGETVSWNVGAAKGKLRVHNALDETLSLSMNGVELASLEPQETFVSADIPAGPHRLVAQGVRSGAQRTAQRIVGPRDEASWSIQSEPARLLISNDSSEPILVRIDGRPYGRIEAESRGGIDELPPGQRQLDLLGLRSAWRRSFSLLLPSGGTEVVEIATPMAIVVAENQSGEALSLGVDGAPLTQLEPGAALPLSVPAGQRKLTTLGRDTGHVQTFDLTLEVGQSHHLKIPSARATLVVVNPGETTLTVHLADRVLGDVPPGGKALYEGLVPGYWWLSATDASGTKTHSEHRRVAAGETRSWLLSPELKKPDAAQGADQAN